MGKRIKNKSEKEINSLIKFRLKLNIRISKIINFLKEKLKWKKN